MGLIIRWVKFKEKGYNIGVIIMKFKIKNMKFEILDWVKDNKDKVDEYEENYGINGYDRLLMCESLEEVNDLIGE
jgi:hypothetical protein